MFLRSILRSPLLPASSFFLSSFYGEGAPHSAPDAKRREAAPRVALLHFVEKGDQHARARGADRVAERDGAAVHVHLLRVPAHLPVDRDRLRGEGLVDLHEIEVLRLPAGRWAGT